MIENKIIYADVIDGLKMLDANSVTAVICSPPYNCDLKKYGNHNDNMPYSEYLKWLKQVWRECKRVLRVGGRLIINIDAVTNRQEDKDEEYVRPIYADLINQMRDIGLKFYMESCWYKQNAVGKATAWGSFASCSTPIIRRNHEYILVWSKDQFKLPGDDELSDMTAEEFAEYTLSTWHIVPETKKVADHPAPFPEELVRRLIKLFTYRGDLVCDPFSGTGTTATIAVLLNRRYIGIDNNLSFCDYARERVSDAKSLMQFDPPYVKRSERLSSRKEQKAKEKEMTMIDFS